MIIIKIYSNLRRIPSDELWKKVEDAIRIVMKEDFQNSELNNNSLVISLNNSLIKNWEVVLLDNSSSTKIQSIISLERRIIFYLLLFYFASIVAQILIGLPMLDSILWTTALAIVLVSLIYYFAVKPIAKAIVKKAFLKYEMQ